MVSPKTALVLGRKAAFSSSLGTVGVHEGELDAHPLHGHGEEVEGPPVDGGGGHHMVPGGAEVEDGEEVGQPGRKR